MTQFAYGNPSKYYIITSLFYENGCYDSKPKKSFLVCCQETTEEIKSFFDIKDAYKFTREN